MLFFLANWGKISPSSAEAQPPQQESLTPIRQTLLLYEGRLHPATNTVYTNATIIRQAWQEPIPERMLEVMMASSVLKAWVMKAAVELCVENWSVVRLSVSRY